MVNDFALDRLRFIIFCSAYPINLYHFGAVDIIARIVRQ